MRILKTEWVHFQKEDFKIRVYSKYKNINLRKRKENLYFLCYIINNMYLQKLENMQKNWKMPSIFTGKIHW